MKLKTPLEHISHNLSYITLNDIERNGGSCGEEKAAWVEGYGPILITIKGATQQMKKMMGASLLNLSNKPSAWTRISYLKPTLNETFKKAQCWESVDKGVALLIVRHSIWPSLRTAYHHRCCYQIAHLQWKPLQQVGPSLPLEMLQRGVPVHW